MGTVVVVVVVVVEVVVVDEGVGAVDDGATLVDVVMAGMYALSATVLVEILMVDGGLVRGVRV